MTYAPISVDAQAYFMKWLRRLEPELQIVVGDHVRRAPSATEALSALPELSALIKMLSEDAAARNQSRR